MLSYNAAFWKEKAYHYNERHIPLCEGKNQYCFMERAAASGMDSMSASHDNRNSNVGE